MSASAHGPGAATDGAAVFGVAGLGTAIGSWPGTDLREATATILGELPELPHLVELPERGLGADTIGRAGAILVDIELDAATSGYRVSARRSSAGRRAADFLAQDVDVLEELWETAGLRNSGRTVKIQSAGPFTLAAEVELATGHRALTDRGAVRDLADSLAEGLAVHADDVARRLGASVVVQIDEPRIGAVLGGTLTDVTSLDTVRAVPAPDVVTTLDRVIDRVGRPTVVHCCSADVPFEVFARTRAAAVAFDPSVLGVYRYDAVGEVLQGRGTLILGLVPGTAPVAPVQWRAVAAPAVDLIDRLGFPRTVLREQISVSPACGLAGATPQWARTALTLVGEVRRAFDEDPQAL